MRDTSPEIERVLAALAATPNIIVSITNGLDPALLHTKPETDAWSANDLLAHLRSCTDVWGKSIVAMITRDHPTLRYVSPRTWIRKTTYPQQDFHTSLQLFTIKRTELLKLLQPLDHDGWARKATFTGTTKEHDQTVFSYVQRIADHEVRHLAQLEGIVNTLQR